MRTLVVHAHPSPDSYGAALLAATVRGLEAGGHRADVIDLCAEGFRAAMSPEERAAYHGDAPVLDPQVAGYGRRVLAAEHLVFVYPTWWFGLPAVLKGFLDRVLVPGVAFGFDERSGKVVGRLRHVRRLTTVTTYGSHRATALVLNDAGRRTINRTLRLLCHPLCRRRWLGLWSVMDADDATRAAFVARVGRELAR